MGLVAELGCRKSTAGQTILKLFEPTSGSIILASYEIQKTTSQVGVKRAVQDLMERVAVMYLGKIMEVAATDELYKSPHHPYTVALLSAIPIPDPILERKREQIILKGDIPNPVNPPTGCVFNTRCWKAQEKCRTIEPQLVQLGASQVACHFPD